MYVFDKILLIFLLLLKTVKNSIIFNKEKYMKIFVLKALANPVRIFFVPYNLAVFNFLFLLLVYLITFFSSLFLTNGIIAINPLWFMITLVITHSIIAIWAKTEPFLLKIIIAKIKLFKKHIPQKLAA